MQPGDDPSGLKAVLREGYGIPDCAIIPMPLGWMNHGYRIECGSRAYFLKVYDTRHYSAEWVGRVCEVQAIARQAGVPVPEVAPSLEGAPVAVVAGVVCTLSEFVGGHSYSRPTISAAAARAMGQTLARLHAAFRDAEPSLPYEVPDPVRSRERLERALAAAEPLGSRSSVDEVCCQVLRHKLDRLERLTNLVPMLSRLQTQLTHGDYQETNILFAPAADGGERLVAVVDFDAIRHRPRGAEITRCLTLCFLDGESLLPEAWDFVSGYAEVLPLPEDEVRLFAPLQTYLSAIGAWPIFDRYEKPEAYQARWDRFIRPPGDWWGEHMDEMTERLVGALARR